MGYEGYVKVGNDHPLTFLLQRVPVENPLIPERRKKFTKQGYFNLVCKWVFERKMPQCPGILKSGHRVNTWREIRNGLAVNACWVGILFPDCISPEFKKFYRSGSINFRPYITRFVDDDAIDFIAEMEVIHNEYEEETGDSWIDFCAAALFTQALAHELVIPRSLYEAEAARIEKKLRDDNYRSPEPRLLWNRHQLLQRLYNEQNPKREELVMH